jgi:hypothetical protein
MQLPYYSISAPPSLGDDETIEVIAGLVVTMNCNPKQEEGLKSTVTWLVVCNGLSFLLAVRFPREF